MLFNQVWGCIPLCNYIPTKIWNISINPMYLEVSPSSQLLPGTQSSSVTTFNHLLPDFARTESKKSGTRFTTCNNCLLLPRVHEEYSSSTHTEKVFLSIKEHLCKILVQSQHLTHVTDGSRHSKSTQQCQWYRSKLLILIISLDASKKSVIPWYVQLKF